jgi:two-component sensor histidine kinase
MVSAIRATSRWSLPLKILCAVFGTLGCFLVQLPIESRSVGDPFTVFLAWSFIVGLLFGRMAAGVAIVLAALLSSLFFEPIGLPHLIRAIDLVQIQIFALLAAGAALLADQIRLTLLAVSDANQVLAAEDSRKTMRLQEVAHRIANSFSSLDALIRQRAKLANDPKMTFAFEQASELIHIVARLSNRLSLTDSCSTVNSEVFVRDVCEDLKACASPSITFDYEAESHELPLGIAVPLGLVINELVTNALKYAFEDREAGRIRIVFARESDHFVLEVEDDGTGMDHKVQGGGAGMPLLNGLARSLSGQFELTSTPMGTRAVMAFPAPERIIPASPQIPGYLH